MKILKNISKKSVIILLSKQGRRKFYQKSEAIYLFFKSLDFQNPESLVNPLASKWYSVALLALLGIGILAYAIKFFATSEWVNLLRNVLQLIVIGIVINKPIENPFVDFPYFYLQTAGNWIIAIVAVLIAIDFLKSLIVIGKNALTD